MHEMPQILSDLLSNKGKLCSSGTVKTLIYKVYQTPKLNISRLVLQLSLPNPLKPVVQLSAAPTTSEFISY